MPDEHSAQREILFADWREAEEVAHHEAGHAVAAYLAGFPIVRVSIEGGEDHAGRLTLSEPTMRRLREWRCFRARPAGIKRAESFVFVLLAGAEATRVFRGESGDAAAAINPFRVTRDEATNWKDCLIAMDYIAKLLDVRGVHDPDASLAELRRLSLDARRRIEEPAVWCAVEAVARELTDEQTLDRGLVRSVIAYALKRGAASPAHVDAPSPGAPRKGGERGP